MQPLRLVDTSGSVCLVAPGQSITPSMRATESRLGVRFRHGTVAELAAEAIRRAEAFHKMALLCLSGRVGAFPRVPGYEYRENLFLLIACWHEAQAEAIGWASR